MLSPGAAREFLSTRLLPWYVKLHHASAWLPAKQPICCATLPDCPLYGQVNLWVHASHDATVPVCLVCLTWTLAPLYHEYRDTSWRRGLLEREYLCSASIHFGHRQPLLFTHHQTQHFRKLQHNDSSTALRRAGPAHLRNPRCLCKGLRRPHDSRPIGVPDEVPQDGGHTLRLLPWIGISLLP